MHSAHSFTCNNGVFSEVWQSGKGQKN